MIQYFTNLVFIIVLLFGVSSCEKEEEPIKLPPKPAEAKLLTVNMGEKYTQQVFVNLRTGQTTYFDNLSWDLCFDASGTSIYQNGGKNVLIANSGYKTYQKNQPTALLNFKWDEASGYADSLVMKNACRNNVSNDSVYIIKRDATKELLQFKVISITDTEYKIEFSDMANSYTKQVTIAKDETKSMVYFSFDNGGTYLNVEPPKNDWHICFLRYRWIFYEFARPLPYTVSGVFINTKFTTAAIDSSMEFYEVKKQDAVGFLYKSKRDAIGFEWKSPDLSNTSNVKYQIHKHITYCVKENDALQKIYKLRFLDFYNDKGLKGSPQFEVQTLD